MPSDTSVSVGEKHIRLLEGGYRAEKAMRLQMEGELQSLRDREVELEARILDLERSTAVASTSTQLPRRLESLRDDQEVQKWKRTWDRPF